MNDDTLRAKIAAALRAAADAVEAGHTPVLEQLLCPMICTVGTDWNPRPWSWLSFNESIRDDVLAECMDPDAELPSTWGVFVAVEQDDWKHVNDDRMGLVSGVRLVDVWPPKAAVVPPA